MESAAAKPQMWGIRTMTFVGAVLSLLWLYYLLVVDTHVRDGLRAATSILPDSFAKLLVAVGALLAYFIPTLAIFMLCLRFGSWFDVGRRLPRIGLEAYREANRQALAEIRAISAAELARQKAAGASELELADLTRSLEDSMAKTEADAARREALYAKDPALLDKELRETMDSIRARQRFKGL